MATEMQSVTINTSGNVGPGGTVRNDPGAKKVVYNMYRDMLKNYNGRANEMLETKPASCLTEDRGIGDRLESMVRQTLGNQMPADYADSVSAGGPPPPPPPPLALGAVPAVRLKAEISERRPEPPACVQNAMMTKDKKPFTYTPGGIDLSQIRSPRMARRITRNANAEGVQPDAARPAGAPQHGPLPPSALAAMQPQLPVQVFPTGGGPPAAMAPPPPPPPPPVPGPGAAPIMSQPPSTKAPSPPNSNSQMPYVRPDIKIPENPMGLLRKTGGPHRTQPDVAQPSVPQPVQAAQPVQAVQPPQAVYKPVQQPSVTSPIQVVQPPLPQPVYKPVQPPVTSPVQAMPQPVYQPRPAMAVSPEQKQENRQQVGSIYIPPLNSEELQKSPSTPQKSVPESPGSPMDTLKKAPTPWLTGRVQPKPQDPPAWARSPPESVASSTPTTPATPSTPGTPGVTRVIPIRIERTEDAKDIQQQQQQQQMYQQQQRQQQQQYQQQMQQQMMQQYRQQQQQFQQQPTHSVRMIPIQIEGQMTHVGPMSPSGNMATTDLLGAPVQSPTFRILQRVTSRDEELHSHPAIHHPPSLGHAFPVEQMRKMQLTEDEKALMNRVRNQVPRAVIINRGPQPQGGIRKSNSPRTPDGEGALPPSEQRVPEPRKYTGSAIPSRSFQMLQAMVAPENCANGSETDDNASYPYDPNMCPWGYNPMYPPPPPPYWNDPYWGYYATDACPTDAEPVAATETGTETTIVDSSTERNCETPAPMSQEEYYAQMPYWDPYYAYYAAYYGYYPPHAYSPHAFYPSNETDDYSSNDEMAYYGARFPPGAVPCGHESAPLAAQEQVTPTDTEVEEITEAEEKSERQAGSLQAIKSVSDIQVYNENASVDESSTTEEEVESSESDEEEEDSDSTEDGADDSSHLPHQLSVILEESELSEAERRKRETSVATTVSEDDSSTTIGGDSLDEQDMEEATVTVRLPLKLKFGMSEDGKEGVTEVIVGDSELKHHTPDTSVSVTLNIDAKSEEPLQPKSAAAVKQQIRSPFRRQASEETENYETAEDTDAQDTRENSPVQSADEYEDGDTDFWDEIEKKVKSEDEDDVSPQDKDNESEAESITKVEIKDKNDAKEESRVEKVPSDVEEKAQNDEEVEEDDEDDDDDDSSDSDENSDDEETDDCKLEKDLRDAFASDAVKERVRALRETGKARIGEDLKEVAVSVRQRILAIENGGSSTGATSASRSSSMKGCDFSEEDGDSGVTSDVSRHTDTESDYFTEQLRKRYQRASTHSRLFKLLQDECSKSDDEGDDEEDDVELRRKQLSLPLSGSEPESGICSPASPIWLARELVHGLLGGRRGRKYKSLPVERLYAAAQRILQEDARSNTSEDGSPLESYAADYRSYYSSWEDAGSRCSSAMKKRIARCPRVKSEKNVPARVAEMEESEDTGPCPVLSPSESRQQLTSAS